MSGISGNWTVNSHHRNSVAAAVDWGGRILTCPSSRLLEAVAKILRPIIPGHSDQASSKSSEIAIRCARVVLCTLSLPVIAFGVVGAALRSAASFSRGEFVFFQPNTPPEPRVIDRITLCTFNGAMMPSWMNIIARDFSPPRDRVEAMARCVNESAIDVLCMQEVFNTEAADQFIDLIKNRYPYVIYNAGFHSLGLSSGLLIASKFPMVNPKFWAYAHKIGTEHFASKGALAVTIQPNARQSIAIFNTHLEAGMDAKNVGDAVAVRVAQLSDLQGYIASYVDGLPVAFLCGDFNIRSDLDKEELDSKKLQEIILDDVSELRAGGTYYQRLPIVHEQASDPCSCGSADQILKGAVDHIGVIKPATISEVPSEVSRSCFNGTSDHMAWIATFNL